MRGARADWGLQWRIEDGGGRAGLGRGDDGERDGLLQFQAQGLASTQPQC